MVSVRVWVTAPFSDVMLTARRLPPLEALNPDAARLRATV
jgi:hypothetical protein